MKTPFLALIPALFLLGCGNPADNVPSAAVRAATNAPAAGPQGTLYAMTTNMSSIEFTGSKVTGKHDGGFHNFAGEFNVVDGKVASTGNLIMIDTTSLFSDSDRLTGHLKNADFFDVAQFPTATFTSTAVQQNGTNAQVTGNLTLHGVTKEISFPAQIEVTAAAVKIKAEFVLKRFDFNMKYPGRADDLIREEVVLRLNVQATPGRANFDSVQKKGSAAVSG